MKVRNSRKCHVAGVPFSSCVVANLGTYAAYLGNLRDMFLCYTYAGDFMNADSDNPSAVEDSTPNKELSEMDIKKIMIYRQIGAKIAYYRTLRQMTQAELAKKVNLSRSSIVRIERGKYNNGVPISTLLDIAEGLRIDLASLVTFSEEEKKVWWEIYKHML